MRKAKPNLSEHPVVQERIKTVPSAWRKAYRLAISGKSRTAALKVFCGACVGWVRKEVRLCSSPDCPLFPYRPFQSEDEAADETAEVTVSEDEDEGGEPCKTT